MNAPDYDEIVRAIVAQQLSFNASLTPTVWQGQTQEYALVVQDGDLSRATLWRNQETVARVDLTSMSVEVGAPC